MEAFAYLHSPFTKAVKQELENKTIGDVVYMESAFMTSSYDLSNIRMRKDTLGGALYDLGCYNTSQILWMLEEEPENIQAISEFSQQGVDMYTTAFLNFKSGKRAVLNCGMNLQPQAAHCATHRYRDTAKASSSTRPTTAVCNPDRMTTAARSSGFQRLR